MLRYTRVIAAAILILLAGCSGSGFMPVSRDALNSGTETPLASNAFADSVGVNLHLTYGGTPYDNDFGKWAPVLMDSGVKHVRDAVCSWSLSWCRRVAVAHLKRLGTAGITAELVTSLKDSASWDASYVQRMGLKNVDGFEGPNECDTGLYCPDDWKQTESAWQKAISSFAAHGVTIIGPSMVTQGGYVALGNLSAYMDVGNIHDYPGQQPPESMNGGPSQHLQWASAMSGGKPVWATETGYATERGGVTPLAQERYITRTLFEDLRVGVMRTYVYQLFDYGPDAGANMGLLRADYSSKPAWAQLKQLIAFFKDAGDSPRTPLSYQIQGDAKGTLHHVLFQRSDGTYELALWCADPLYDPKTHADMGIDGEAVRIVLPGSVTSATQVQFMDGGATKTQAPLPVSNGTVTVTATSAVSVLTFRT